VLLDVGVIRELADVERCFADQARGVEPLKAGHRREHAPGAPSRRQGGVRMRAWNDPTKQQFALAFLAHARGMCPATPDAPVGPDQIALAIIPTNSLDCAAVRDPGAPNPVDYATNSNANGNVVAGGLAAGGRALNKIANTVQGTHAEMVLLDAFPPPAMARVGISKQTCLLCCLALQIAGVATRGCHGQLYDAWKFPAFIKNNALRLNIFLGAGALAVYNQLSQQNQANALRLIETNLKQYDR
jgi:hypothetical protein